MATKKTTDPADMRIRLRLLVAAFHGGVHIDTLTDDMRLGRNGRAILRVAATIIGRDEVAEVRCCRQFTLGELLDFAQAA